MDAFSFKLIVTDNLIFLFQLLCLIQIFFFQLSDISTKVRKNKELRVTGDFSKQVDTFIGKVDGVILFIDHKVELVVHNVHVFTFFLQVEILSFLHQGPHPFLRKEFNQGLVFWQSPETAKQEQSSFFLFF